MREAVLPPKVQRLRQKLSSKAKEQKRFRFYSLYDKIIDKETLKAAYRQVRANDGAAGADGITLVRIDEGIGEERFVDELHMELKTRRYKASPVRRVYIPKANGKLRPLGIPVIKDRVVQAAVVLIIEPIFEADFEDCSYGFRPGRGAHQALEQITAALKAGKTEVYDADLEGYFDSIPHDRLEVRKDEGSVATLQSPGDRLAGCSSWHLRFAVYSSGGNLSRRSSCWRWDGTCAFPCRTATSKSCSPSGVCKPTTSRCGDGFSGMRPNCSGAYAAT